MKEPTVKFQKDGHNINNTKSHPALREDKEEEKKEKKKEIKGE
jgi:hypothetical protein